MDYFSKKIDQKINFSKELENVSQLKIFLQVKIEYSLLFLLIYYKNKNFNLLELEDQEYINKLLVRPTIGDIVDAIKHLSKNEEKNTRKMLNFMDKYTSFRNQNIGHGFVFEDGTSSFIKDLDDIITSMNSIKVLKEEFDYVYVINKNDSFYTGIIYTSLGEQNVWKIPIDIRSFEIDCTYIVNDKNEYFELKPYIFVDENENIWLYSKMTDSLLGRVEYNQVFSTNKKIKDWQNLNTLTCVNDENRKIFVNKTIANNFDKNYTQYFEIGLKEIIKEFLQKDKSMVACTLWGHGGVGKTAVIQSIIEEYELAKEKIFDYIIFVSAKDRMYNYKNGHIEEIVERIDSFSDILLIINQVLGIDNSTEQDNIINVDGKVLIVIDDLETFNKSEVEKIQSFIKKLDINRHKVVFTTRTNSIIGQEIKTNELSLEQTNQFLIDIFTHDLKSYILQSQITKDHLNRIHSLTSGRPLFIYQIAFLISQRGLSKALMFDIKNTENAVQFLYGRIYDYLSTFGKIIFIAIGQLIQSDDRTGAINTIQYVLDCEKNKEQFEIGFSELIKLKVVEKTGDGLYRVYSDEILNIMKDYYRKRDLTFPSKIFEERINQLCKSSSNDIEKILLENANNARFTQTREDVSKLYEEILSREIAPDEIKLDALIQYSSYLYNDLMDYDETKLIMGRYYSKFKNQPEFIKFYSSVLWAAKDRKMSIKVLEKYLSETDIFSNTGIEIFCSLAIKKSINIIDIRESIKISYSEDSFARLKSQKKDFYDYVEKIGKNLFQYVYKYDIENLPSKNIQNLFSAIIHAIDVYLRIQKYEDVLNYKSVVLKKFEKHPDMIMKLKLKYDRCELYRKQRIERIYINDHR
ncbi:MAG: NB-ARC domain-containing protein [Treponemataceae bacterium]|nr:NB-ARC domain-containing protein [Treponemataceae bacterium]